jgi:hypothetical protein
MDHETVQRKVLGALPGNYLIRESRTSDNLVLVVNDRGAMANFTIFVNRGPAAAVGIFTLQEHPFGTLVELIAWAKGSLYSYSQPGTRMVIGMSVPLEPWFAGDVSKTEVETAVLAASHGTFLVRRSSDNRKFVVVVHDCGQVRCACLQAILYTLAHTPRARPPVFSVPMLSIFDVPYTFVYRLPILRSIQFRQSRRERRRNHSVSARCRSTPFLRLFSGYKKTHSAGSQPTNFGLQKVPRSKETAKCWHRHRSRDT